MKTPGRGPENTSDKFFSLKRKLSKGTSPSHRVQYEMGPKNKTVTLRMSAALLDAVKMRAEQSGIDYQKFIRLALERVVQRK